MRGACHVVERILKFSKIRHASIFVPLREPCVNTERTRREHCRRCVSIACHGNPLHTMPRTVHELFTLWARKFAPRSRIRACRGVVALPRRLHACAKSSGQCVKTAGTMRVVRGTAGHCGTMRYGPCGRREQCANNT